MNTIRLLGAIVWFIVCACGTAWSQPFPSKPVRVVVVFPPGGATDVVARFVFQKVGEQLNQQFPIDNRAGAGGIIGAEIVAKSPPDGYTIMVYSQTFVANAHLYSKAAVRPAQRLHRDNAGRAAGGHPCRAPLDAGAHDARLHRLGESAARRGFVTARPASAPTSIFP